MKYFITFILGFISYACLLEYVEYKDYKNWNVATFKDRNLLRTFESVSDRIVYIEQNIETTYDKVLVKLLYRPYLGKNCLYTFSNKSDCVFESLGFNPDKLKYTAYCDNQVITNIGVLEADRYVEKKCRVELTNEEEL